MVQARKAGNSPMIQPSQPIPEPVPLSNDSNVYVDGKPVADNARTSGATKEAGASKTAEQKLAGQAQEVWLREQLTVLINAKATHRKDDRDQHCGDIKTPEGGQGGDSTEPQGAQGSDPMKPQDEQG